MIIDFDSHLREGYFMDEVYKFEGRYERFRPIRMGNGHSHKTKFQHSLDPISPQGHAAHRHPYIYDPDVNWRGGSGWGSGVRMAISSEGGCRSPPA